MSLTSDKLKAAAAAKGTAQKAVEETQDAAKKTLDAAKSALKPNLPGRAGAAQAAAARPVGPSAAGAPNRPAAGANRPTGQAPAGANRPAPGTPPPHGTPRPAPGGGKPKPVETPFTDVPKDAPYAAAVNWAVENKIANGTTETTFAPDDECTRAQVVTFLWRAKGSPAPKGGGFPFEDVKADSPFYSAIAWAYENEIAAGNKETEFAPDKGCTKGQFVTFLWRAQGKPAAKGPAAQSGEYYAEALAWARSAHALPPEKDFDADAACTRAGVVDALFHALGKK